MIRGAESVGIETLSAATATLDERLAQTTAEFLVIVRWGVVVPDLLPKAVGFLDRFPSIEITYGDSVTEAGLPLLRPLFSPIRLRSNEYLGPVVVARVPTLRALGGFRPEARRAQVLDLALRASAEGRSVALVPAVLATEDLAPGDFAGTAAAQTRVVAAHLEGLGIRAAVDEVEPFVRRVRYELDDAPLVSVVIPTRGGSAPIAGTDRVLVVEADPGHRRAVHLPEPRVRRRRRRRDARRGRHRARGAVRRSPAPRALGRPLQLQRQDEPRRRRGIRRVPAAPQRRRRGRDRRLDRDAARARAPGRRGHRRRPALLRGQHGAARRADLHRRRRRARRLRLGRRTRRLDQVDGDRPRGLGRHRRVRAHLSATCTSRSAASRSPCPATTTTST